MKVLIVMPLAEQRGGGELMLLHVLQQGRGQGTDWLIVFLEDGPMVTQVRELGVPAWIFPAGRLREPHVFARTIRHIADLVKQERADLVLGWMSKAQWYGGPAAALAKVPAVWYQLGLPDPPGWLDRIATALPARAILACSQFGADAQGRVRPSRPLRVVHPGVELERFDPAVLPDPVQAREKLGLPLGVPLIGIVGRMQRWKGIHVLIEAMPNILKTYPDAHCVVVGGDHSLEPDYPAFVAERIAALGLEQSVLLAGLQRNVPEWMQAMDVIVHASDREPFGIVVIEAMALGKPVVAGNAGGPTEIITDGVDGLLTPYGDAAALAGAVLRYLNDPQFAQMTGRAAKARAQAFSTADYARNMIDVLEGLTATRSVPVVSGK